MCISVSMGPINVKAKKLYISTNTMNKLLDIVNRTFYYNKHIVRDRSFNF